MTAPDRALHLWSAWIEYLRRSNSAVDLRLTELISELAPLATTEPVIMQVVAGARTDADEEELRRLLGRFELLPLDPVVDFDGAARLYRSYRRRGVTPRGLLDCLIASVAWRSGAALLAHDSDLERIALVAGIPLEPTAP